MAKAEPEFASETALVAAFVEYIEKLNAAAAKYPARRHGGEHSTWTVYHESCGYDLVVVEDQTGIQIGIEAKLTLNTKVINQVLPSRYHREGPDYRAVLVPRSGVQLGLFDICTQIGITVLTVYDSHMRSDWHKSRGIPHKPDWHCIPQLPDERSQYGSSLNDWNAWLPEKRCTLPEYVPDVVGGKAAPLALTQWKIRAIKLLIVLERRGFVTRKDMRLLEISPTRWCAGSYGYLLADKAAGGYVACTNTPDLRRQHPVNYAQIEADYEKWSKALEKE